MSIHQSFSNSAACPDPTAFIAIGCKAEDEPGKDKILHFKLGTPSAVWVYRDQAGCLIGYVCRFDVSEKGKKPHKEYRPYFHGRIGKGNPSWEWKAPTVPRPLYKLDQIAINSNKPILICEGEKAADAANVLFPDHVCTTPMNGAQSPKKSDWSLINGRHVVVGGDNDAAGKKFANTVARLAMEAGAASVQILDVSFIGKHSVTSGEVSLREGDGPADCPPKWDLADAVQEGWTAELMEKFIKDNSSKALEDFVLPEWPFRQARWGVEVRVKIDKELAWVKVFSPFVVLGKARDHDSGDWSYVVTVTDPDGEEHTELIKASGLEGNAFSEVKARLRSLGLVFSDPVSASGNLRRYLEHAPTERRIDLVTKSGWQSNGSFATPAWVANPESNSDVFFDERSSSPTNFGSAGTLEDWQQHVAKPVENNPLLEFALSCAFAPILLTHSDNSSHGFHLFGSSSTGKTTALNVAASVWGAPEKYLKTWNLTSTALEGTAVVHNNVLLCLDEIGQANPDDVWTAGYMLANGQGKGRGTVTGGVRELASWELIFLSSGEVPFEDHARSRTGQSAKAGQKARIISIPADAGSDMGIFSNLPSDVNGAGDFANLLRANTNSYCGVAARAFVETIMRDTKATKIRLQDILADFVAKACPNDADGQVGRVAANFGLVAAAGEIAIQNGILPWETGRAFDAAVFAFERWLKHRGGTKSDELLQGRSQVRHFIEKHGEDRFTVIVKVGNSWKNETDDDDFDSFGNRTRDRVGCRYKDKNGLWTYLIFTGAWKADVCDGFDSSLIASELASQGHLRRSGNRNSVVRNLPGIGKTRVYELNSSILSDQGGE